MSRSCCSCDGGIKWRSRKRGSILFVLFGLLLMMVSMERLVIDTLGQMWGTLIINCATTVCSALAIIGVCIHEKIAIAVFSVWTAVSVGLNILIILIYNDVGLLGKKEHYLGLSLGNDNWWRTHGLGCREVGVTEGSGLQSSDSETTVHCVLSYAIIETIHAVVYMLLSLIMLLLSICLLCSKKKDALPDDDESFNFVSVSQEPTRGHSTGYHGRKWSYSTYDTTISLWYGFICANNYNNH